MAALFQCPKCGKRYQFKPGLAGKQAKCAGCQHVFTVPREPMQSAPARPGADEPLEIREEDLVDEGIPVVPALDDGVTLGPAVKPASGVLPSGARAASGTPSRAGAAPSRPAAAQSRPAAAAAQPLQPAVAVLQPLPPAAGAPALGPAAADWGAAATPAALPLASPGEPADAFSFFRSGPLGNRDKLALGIAVALVVFALIFVLLPLFGLAGPGAASTANVLRIVGVFFGLAGAGMIGYGSRKNVPVAVGAGVGITIALVICFAVSAGAGRGTPPGSQPTAVAPPAAPSVAREPAAQPAAPSVGLEPAGQPAAPPVGSTPTAPPAAAPSSPAAAAGPVNLLSQIDPQRDRVQGEWTLENGRLVAPPIGTPVIQLPYSPPEQYVLTVVAERTSGNESFNIGLVVGGRQTMVALEGWGQGAVALNLVDGQTGDNNETTTHATVFRPGSPAAITCTVRKSAVAVECDGQPLINWSGDPSRLSLDQRFWNGIPPQRLFLATWHTGFRVSKIELRPLND